MYHFSYKTNIGMVTICANNRAITRIHLGEYRKEQEFETELIKKAHVQLVEYLSGFRKQFDLNLEYVSTTFQLSVWNTLRKIPYGEVRSYKEIACGIENPKACQAVGRACGKNPIPIFIPCHRVIGSTGSLVGYNGGVNIKRKLLEIEKCR
ncbi:MAG: methylated-DNA--[protein]-cysteine S-methyltransferase [Holosporaceae bacterium]|nr:methylated-DNA--[protein]-cysteine S-methyltransferase [Holosporaceae bacterium]